MPWGRRFVADPTERVKALADILLESVKDVSAKEIPFVIMACLDVAVRLACKNPDGTQVTVITAIDRLKHTLDAVRVAELVDQKPKTLGTLS